MVAMVVVVMLADVMGIRLEWRKAGIYAEGECGIAGRSGRWLYAQTRESGAIASLWV